ncbi:MAG: DUF4340 domain-containing protein [Cocleimonas sp.]|nr:DUF4340 domain-containing protein [Cocleimonas sp.]
MIQNSTKKRLTLNGLLLLTILGLVWFITHQSNQIIKINSLYDQSMGDEIHSILISYHKTESSSNTTLIELKKEADKWLITKPIKAEADDRKIQHVMTLLSERIDSFYPLAGKDLATFGLDKKQVSITFNGVKIQLGKLNPISHKRYLRKGNTVYIVSETVYGLLIGGVERFMLNPPQ